MPVTTSIDIFRLEIGDTPAAHGLESPRPVPDPEFEALALLNNDEISYFLAAHPSSVLLAVAAACDALAARFAQDVDVTEDGQSFKDSQKAARYQAMAERFRKRAVDEAALAADGAGLPMGRVPARTPTTWQTRF
jgi:hypothetical protein